MGNNEQTELICLTLNNFIILIIFCIIIIILIISLLILAINIINYILFTVYCINDNVTDYLTEDLSTIILGTKYKYRLLNYIKNIHNENNGKSDDVYNVKNNYDHMSSDLYIHTTIEYYNLIVKLLLTIIFVICVALLFNMFSIIISAINNCFISSKCEFILSNIYNVNTYVFYIIIIIVLFIGIHSYIYTYVFNKNIYKDLYDLYGNNESNYKISDILIFNTINEINNTDTKNITDFTISDYLYNLRKYSYENIQFNIFLNNKNVLVDKADLKLKKIRNEGLINNNKFIIPTDLEIDENTNMLFKDIYKTNLKELYISTDAEVKQELLANKIFLYLIYHYVITYNREDPYILHKLNNIYLHTFESIYDMYNNQAQQIFDAKIKKQEDEKYKAMSKFERRHRYDKIIENFKGGGGGGGSRFAGQNAAREREKLAAAAALVATAAAAAALEAENKEITADNKRRRNEILIENSRPQYVPIDKLVLLEKFNTEIKNMYEQINISFTIKFLLPVNTKKEELSKILHSNADLILQYIYKFNNDIYLKQGGINSIGKKILDEFNNYTDIVYEKDTDRIIRINKEETDFKSKDTSEEVKNNLQLKKFKNKLYNKINAFTDVFSDYTQENKTLGYINTIIYKINFYLAAEMMQVIIFILLVLFILYKSKKYPFLEKYINLSIVYAILIINEVVSAILGII